MKRFISKKVLAIGLAVGVTLGAGGAAFAYFAATGSGTGSATVGSPGSWTVTQDSASGTIYPGTGSSVLKFNVKNNSSGDAQYSTATAAVAASGGNITESGTPVAGCLASWFTATVTSDTGANANIASQATATDAVVVTVTMPSDSVDIQNACQGTTPDISVSVS